MQGLGNKKLRMENLNKKEKVVYLAKHDPFLKVEELAEKVGTTPHYVRTVLSEAALSLTKLREDYARKMERLSNSSSDRLLVDVLNTSNLEMMWSKELDRAIMNNCNNYQELVDNDNFQQKSLVLFNQHDPILVNTTFWLSAEGKVIQDINQILELNSDNIEFTSLMLEITEANYYLAEVLEIDLKDQIFKISRKIISDDEIKGVDILYLRSDNYQINLTGQDASLQLDSK
ncbi:hypothetical protein [Sporohalobacter salinus]|uniref:hypothetical protein n=1 Tax=Sporohalobacter salinus TaxID=1494606 RepID=UPI001961F7B0|nr:hypothetical protein [Sporohalobacter salinus]MBM7624615.1 hypothetical protein [Sporohalobacter salinus]